MATFYGWGLTASMLEPLREGSLLFTPKFPEVLILLVMRYSWFPESPLHSWSAPACQATS